jgi:hypothetical protein
MKAGKPNTALSFGKGLGKQGIPSKSTMVAIVEGGETVGEVEEVEEGGSGYEFYSDMAVLECHPMELLSVETSRTMTKPGMREVGTRDERRVGLVDSCSDVMASGNKRDFVRWKEGEDMVCMVRGKAYKARTGLVIKKVQTREWLIQEWMFHRCAFLEGLDKFILSKKVLRVDMGIRQRSDAKREWLEHGSGDSWELVYARGFDAVQWADGSEERISYRERGNPVRRYTL